MSYKLLVLTILTVQALNWSAELDGTHQAFKQELLSISIKLSAEWKFENVSAAEDVALNEMGPSNPWPRNCSYLEIVGMYSTCC
jgi:hypothetical protein